MRGMFVGMIAVALLIGCSSTRPGKMQAVQTHSDQPRAGNVYLLRGFIGIFSTGIDNLTTQLNDNGVRAHVFQDDQWRSLAKTIAKTYRNNPNHEPLILVGHSYGADDVVRIARRLNEDNVKVDLLITLDPVTPPTVPANVIRCVNLYQSNGAADALPWLRGIPLKKDDSAVNTTLVNSDLRKDRTDLLEPNTDHFNIEKKPKVHGEVIRQVLTTCPPRAQWAVSKRGAAPALAKLPTPPKQPATPSAQASKRSDETVMGATGE